MADETQQNDPRAALIALVQRGQAHEEAYRASLSPEERAQTGQADHWAPKEIIAHFAFWKARQAERLAAVADATTVSDGPPWEQVNDETWPEHSRLSWDEAVTRSDKATSDLLDAVGRLPADQFADLKMPESASDRLIATTMGNSYGHIVQHLSDHYLAKGEPEQASQAQEEFLQAILASGFGEAAEMFTRYNLACYYALHGQQSNALAQLRLALPMRPDLVVIAREDHDLDSLRDDPEFKSLLATEG